MAQRYVELYERVRQSARDAEAAAGLTDGAAGRFVGGGSG